MSKKALLIGINYRGTKSALRGCINDVFNTKKVLEEKFAFPEENILVLTDDTPIRPTRRNMEQQIKQFAQNAKEGDTLYFHYSGHGSHVRDISGDESDGMDEVLLPLDFQTAGKILDDWMYANLITKVPKGAKLLCVLDCCHSGTGLDIPYSFIYKPLKIPNPLPQQYNSEDWKETYEMTVEKQQGAVQADFICSFSGCADIQTSADAFLNGSSQGAFTACFLEILRSSHVKQYTLKQLLKEVNCRLIMYRMTQRSQLSVMKKEDCEAPFFL